MRGAIIRRVIDLHAHILPGLDDGPANLDVSAGMARAAVGTGTRVLAATSHINRGFGLRAAELAAARELVVERLAADGIPLEVVQGGEIALSRAGDLDEEQLRALTLGGSRWLLLECPLSPAAPSMEPMVSALRSSGFEILLAHPERSPTMMRSPEALERLIAQGAIAQVTSSALAGDFGEPVRRTAFAMLERGHVHVLASDGHHPTLRPPDLQRALEPLRRRYEDADDQFDWMALQAPRAVLADEPLPPRPPLPRPRGGLLRRFRA
jgi:protein-tyrosine phosphatase